MGYRIIKSFRRTPKVSAVVPVYNSAEYLPQCLESIINQSLNDIEIICVNDGSTDNSLDILKEYKNKDPRVVIVDKPNGGVSSARNAGLKAAKGKYVEFIDSDDLINVETFKNLFEEAEACDADIVTFEKTWFNKNAEPNINQKPEYDIKDTEHYVHDESENPFERDLNCNVIHDKFYKREFLINNNLFFDERVKLGEDSLFCWMSFIRTNTIAVDKNTYYYHRSAIETSLMGSATNQKWFTNYMLIISHLIEHKDDFKFEGSNEWILSWAVGYGTELLNFGTPEEKSENAKLFFDTVGEFLKIEDLKISKNQMREIDKIRSKII
ncbi:MAG: glycosyltransferase [Clostridia bacterium]|nr:glycosyltransferase [Clostridia bacterium]